MKQFLFHTSRIIVIIGCLVGLSISQASALTLKGTLKSNGKESDLSLFTIVAEGSSNNIKSAQLSKSGTFSLSSVASGDRISLLKNNNYYGPLVVAIKVGSKNKSFIGAKSSNLCSKGTAKAIMSLRRQPKGNGKKANKLVLTLDKTFSLAYVKSAVSSGDIVSSGIADVTESTCAPTGVETAESSSLSIKGRSKIILAANPNDPDEDGTENDTDIDDDNNGIPDSFDPDNNGDGVLDDTDPSDNDKTDARVWNFQQLHLDIDKAYNTSVMTVTTAMIDDALKNYGGLAIQVIDGQKVELDCGGGTSGGRGLPYCSAGGTGRAREPYPDGLALPDEMDSDGDGKGEITAGGSGDFQIAPGATSSEIRAGDTFIEEVTDSNGKVKKYAGMINAVVHDVPGIVSVTTALGTNTFSYPTNSNSIGVFSNPILVPSSGDVSVTITTYVPHYDIGNGQRVVPAKIKMISTIPGGPCTYDTATLSCVGGGSGPGLMPGTLYSAPSSGWEVVSDGIQSAATVDTPEGQDGTVTYTLNLTGSGGITGWDAGEYLKVPIQSLDNNGGTAAINVWFKRGS